MIMKKRDSQCISCINDVKDWEIPMNSIPSMQVCKARKDLCCVIPKDCLSEPTIFLKQLMDRAPRNVLKIDREGLIRLHCSMKHTQITQ
jgi:hypothetical protein